MSTRYYLFTLTALLLTASAGAQTAPLTLDQAISSFDKSPRFEKARSASEEASWKRAEAFSNFLPTLSANAIHLLNYKYALTDVPGFPQSIPQIIPTTTYTLGVSWMVFDGFANVERFQAARNFERASRSELTWTEFQGQREVIIAFYRSLAAKVLKSVADANYKTLQEHLGDVKLFRKAGVSTKFEVLQVEVQASAAKSEVRNADDTISVSTLRLGELLGEDLKNRSVEGQLPELDETAIAQLDGKISDRADLQALEKRVTGLEQLSSAAGKHWVPKVGVVAQYQKYNNLNDEWTGDKFRDAYTVGVQFSWAYDGIIGPSARAGQAVEQRFQAQKSLEISKLKADNDIEYWRRKYLYSVSVYKDRREDIAKADEAVRLANEGRRAGTRTNTELLDAEAELFRSRAQSVSAQIGAIEALVSLELATGKEIHKFR